MLTPRESVMAAGVVAAVAMGGASLLRSPSTALVEPVPSGLPATPPPPPVRAYEVMCPTPQNGPHCNPSACAAGEFQATCTDTPDGGLLCRCVTGSR